MRPESFLEVYRASERGREILHFNWDDFVQSTSAAMQKETIT